VAPSRRASGARGSYILVTPERFGAKRQKEMTPASHILRGKTRTLLHPTISPADSGPDQRLSGLFGSLYPSGSRDSLPPPRVPQLGFQRTWITSSQLIPRSSRRIPSYGYPPPGVSHPIPVWRAAKPCAFTIQPLPISVVSPTHNHLNHCCKMTYVSIERSYCQGKLASVRQKSKPRVQQKAVRFYAYASDCHSTQSQTGTPIAALLTTPSPHPKMCSQRYGKVRLAHVEKHPLGFI
jgi:hypothetical protein